jgi:hypothetical protein
VGALHVHVVHGLDSSRARGVHEVGSKRPAPLTAPLFI